MTRDLSKRGAGLQASLLGPSRPGVPMPGKALAVPPEGWDQGLFPISSSRQPAILSHTTWAEEAFLRALSVHRGAKGKVNRLAETEGQWLRVKKLLKQQDGPLSSPNWRESPGQWKRSPLEGCRSSGLREGGWLTLCPQCFSPSLTHTVQWLL